MKNLILISVCFFFLNQATAQENISMNSVPAAKKRVVSFSFFAPMNHHVSFNYEQVLAPQASVTGSIGIIGPGLTDNYRQSTGMILKVGTRLYTSPDWMTDGMHRYNNLQGNYFEPQFIFSEFNSRDTYSIYDYLNGTSTSFEQILHTNAWALMLNFGHQKVFANVVTLDTYCGIGYGGHAVNQVSGITSYDYSTEGNHYSHVGGLNEFPIAFNCGLNIGILIK